MALSNNDFEELLEKYKRKLQDEFEHPTEEVKPIKSAEYSDFKKSFMPAEFTIYEKLCNFCEKILKPKIDPKKRDELKESIDICHLGITPEGAVSFSILMPMLIIIIGIFISIVIPMIINTKINMFFAMFFMLMGLALMAPFGKIPYFFANSWRMKASNQMVICIFYIVTYMRHTSNLERAIDFASEHLTPPLSMDLKRVLWNFETGKFDTVKDSLENYLITWKKYNIEFVESFHLIESSLFESAEQKRLATLDRALSLILEETFDKMMHFAQNLKSPITMLHMLGIIMPILGLVILPLVISFMQQVLWYHIAIIYNVILPLGVYYLGKEILSTRPTGYGDTDISELPDYQGYRGKQWTIFGKKVSVAALSLGLLVFVVFFLIGISPLLLHIIMPKDFDVPIGSNFHLLEYKEVGNKTIGPFGFGASILSLFVILAIGLGYGLYHRHNTQKLMKIREETKKLEEEFAAALFQLGNRLSNNIPAEIAFDKVSKIMEDTRPGTFFKIVSNNISRLGMSVEQAIFDLKVGALIYYPSAVIKSSMKVLIEGVKKGPLIAAKAVMDVGEYIKEIHKVNERLKDLLADIISSMKSQISVLTPIIAGIVVGITSMITTIINKLGELLNTLGSSGDATGSLSNIKGIFGMFSVGIPVYHFQIIVGLYVIQITIILTILVNGIENGSDSLNEKYTLGENVTRATILYCLIALIFMVIFNVLANSILSQVAATG